MPDGPYETLAGFVLDRLGRIPQVTEMVEYDGWRIEVLAVDGRRIVTLRVVAPSRPVDHPGAPGRPGGEVR